MVWGKRGSISGYISHDTTDRMGMESYTLFLYCFFWNIACQKEDRTKNVDTIKRIIINVILLKDWTLIDQLLNNVSCWRTESFTFGSTGALCQEKWIRH